MPLFPRRALFLLGCVMPALAWSQAAPLVEAAERGDLAAVRRLLDGGAAIEQRDSRGRPAAVAATDRERTEVARLLIARGADVNAQDQQQGSAFLLAGARGYTEIVRAALGAGQA